ncbi:MAG: hypothetical protein O7E52_19980 [Candidatus Poribacteria bacterium]|nr:hypothetical protein [Candidatus Poribacteria bacterium]
MKSVNGIGVFTLLIVVFVTPCLAVDYWWVNGHSSVLVHAVVNDDDIQIDKHFPPANRRSATAIHPVDGSCWVADTFQGRVTQYTPQHKTISLAGFAAPVALAFHPRTNTLWIADAALHFVAEVSMTGKTLQRIKIHSPQALAIGPDGNCWVLTWRGIQPIVDGRIMPSIQKAVQYIAHTPDTTAVWSVSRKGMISRFDSNGMQRLPFALPDCRGVVGTPDGGCWLLTSRQAIRISGQMALVGEIAGFDWPKALIAQPTDGSVWVIDSGYDRTVRLPERDTPSANSLAALTGWGAVVRNGTVKREVAVDLHWESFLTPETEASPLTAESPQQEASPAPAGEPLPEMPSLSNPEIIPILDEEMSLTPEMPLEEAEPEIVENPAPEAPALEEPEAPNAPPTPEAAPQLTQPTAEEGDTPMPETAPQAEPEAPALLPTPEETPESPQPTIVRIPPDETFAHIPEFPNGGITFVKLYDALSQQRIKNTEQTLGRRFIWNFDGESYTLLLGLSIEAYNTYSNRAREKWVQMVMEGTPAAMELVKPMQELAQKNGWAREKLANFVLSFVQSLPYTADDVATGYDEFKMYAFETLVAGGGDCEDTVILAASLLLALNYDLMLLNPKGHLAFGVVGDFSGAYFEHNDKRYFYSETTGTGWSIGDIPDMYASVPVTLYEVPQWGFRKE